MVAICKRFLSSQLTFLGRFLICQLQKMLIVSFPKLAKTRAQKGHNLSNRIVNIDGKHH